MEDLYEFYNMTDRPKTHIDFNFFQQAMAHYLQQGGNLAQYFKYRDNEFEIMYVKNLNGEVSLMI